MFVTASTISILHTQTVNAKRCSSSCNHLERLEERETTQSVVILVESVSLLWQIANVRVVWSNMTRQSWDMILINSIKEIFIKGLHYWDWVPPAYPTRTGTREGRTRRRGRGGGSGFLVNKSLVFGASLPERLRDVHFSLIQSHIFI